MYKINARPANYSVQDLIEKIDKGYKLQALDESIPLLEEDILKYNDSIVLAPDYQREYRFTIKDESSLIESLLMGIPIPPVFLASDRYNGVQVMNVVDGQHRLRAFYRFVKDKFQIKDIKLLKAQLEGRTYKECSIEDKQTILSREISSIVFRDFPGKEAELEIFNRYNKGTKPLTPQEIRHAVYHSELNSYVNRLAKKLVDEKESILAKAYNVTDDRMKKKKLHENIFVILSILEKGIKPELIKSLDYAEAVMKEKSDLEKENPSDAKANYIHVTHLFEQFNKMIELFAERVEYPFSRELYGVSSRNYKFQISIAMILAGIFHKMFINGVLKVEDLEQEVFLNDFLESIAYSLSTSYLEDVSDNGSSTNSAKMNALINSYEFQFQAKFI
ncbi:DUF262 domain-containing protein [Bacillus cereus]|uniref:GmrSD restriction endonuclease domain-containing protein n=1 Tax=Bacillus cereus TaxID=1396 RepID=UPI0020407DA5|nr:DUF262 domain-containing protein [Bacillus cereus]MCM3330161.1 DUF262 domain-containing protein [Bacillus cereus]MEB9970087.1 DUF262 domain-containing protein [Bacillus cereus]